MHNTTQSDFIPIGKTIYEELSIHILEANSVGRHIYVQKPYFLQKFDLKYNDAFTVSTAFTISI